jgi:hypothetical protein
MARLRPILLPLMLALLAAANLAAQTQPRPRPMGIGPEVRVDTLPGDSKPGCPAIAVGPDRSSELVWAYAESTPYDVYGRHFSPVLVPTDPAQVEIGPAGSASDLPAVYGVATDPSGFQALTARVLHFTDLEIFRRQLDPAGKPVSGLVPVGGTHDLGVWPGPRGTVYTGTYLKYYKRLVVQQRLPNGKPAGPPVVVNSRLIDAPGLRVAPLDGDDGDFVAVWSGFAVKGSPVRQVIRARVFRHNIPRRGQDTEVNATPGGVPGDFPILAGDLAVAVNPRDPGFTVAWTVENGGFSGTIQGRGFDAQGRPATPQRTLWGDLSFFVTLAYDDAGNVLGLWDTPLTPRSEILGRLFRSDLSPISIPFEPWSEASGDFNGPLCAQAVWAGDSWRIAWTAETSKGGPRAVFVRRFTRGTPGS